METTAINSVYVVMGKDYKNNFEWIEKIYYQEDKANVYLNSLLERNKRIYDETIWWIQEETIY